MSADFDVLVCSRCSESEPKVESFVDTCRHCKQAVWRAYSSPPVETVLCIDCGLRQMKKEGAEVQIQPPTEEQLEDARQWWLLNRR
jgi:hypothetical protein